MQTLLLDTAAWDLVLDIDGDIAVADDPYSQAQDAASAIRTYRGEVYYDVTQGVPYYPTVLGEAPSLALLKTLFNAAALTVPGVTAARSFITSFVKRQVSGQVQITNVVGATSAAGF